MPRLHTITSPYHSSEGILIFRIVSDKWVSLANSRVSPLLAIGIHIPKLIEWDWKSMALAVYSFIAAILQIL